MMTVEIVVLLLAAGFVGGMANAMAGGASLVTFPAMMAAGLPPIIANASNTVAVVSGSIIGAWQEWHKRPPFNAKMWFTCMSALVGGGLGGLLLLNTPESLFVKIVPALIGLATIIFAFSKSIQLWVSEHKLLNGESLRTGLIFPSTIYGGYFGAGLGLIIMAVISATSDWELRSANAVKNILSVLANFAAIAIFIQQEIISWPETLTMIVGCLIGGYVGVRALRVIPVVAMRKAIISIGAAMTAYYVWKFWF